MISFHSPEERETDMGQQGPHREAGLCWPPSHPVTQNPRSEEVVGPRGLEWVGSRTRAQGAR